jgi:hypothetical protein
MSLDKALQDAVKNVPEAVAAGYIDLDSGMLLGIKTVDSHPSEVIDVLAAATSDLFQGSNVLTIENMFKKIRGIDLDNHHYFQEIIINSDNLVHVFIRAKSNESHVLCVVCRISTNMGMALTKTRQAIVNCESAI